MREEREGKGSVNKVARCCISQFGPWFPIGSNKQNEGICITCVCGEGTGGVYDEHIPSSMCTHTLIEPEASIGCLSHCSPSYFLRQGFSLNQKLYDWLDFLGNKLRKPPISACRCRLSAKLLLYHVWLLEWMLRIWTQSLILTRTYVAESLSLQPREPVWRMAYIWVWLLCSTVSYKCSVIAPISLYFWILIQRDRKAFIVVINFYWI